MADAAPPVPDYPEAMFLIEAERIGVPPALYAELYPMVRDLRALADEVNGAAATLPVHALPETGPAPGEDHA